MTIRSKSILAIALTFITIILLSWLISKYLLLENLNKLETADAMNELDRVTKILSYITNELDATTTDWASWNDTYSFVLNSNNEYKNVNLVDSTFQELRLNLMVFLDVRGQVVYQKAYDLEAREEIPLPAVLLSLIKTKNQIENGLASDKTRSGLIFPSDDVPLLISYKPILDSDSQGPTHGTLIFGRYLNKAEINRIALLTSFSITPLAFNENTAPEEIQLNEFERIKASGKLVRLFSEKYSTGYLLFRDITNNPGIILKIKIPRNIYQDARSSIYYFLVVITVVLLFFGFMAVLSAEKEGLYRLKLLANTVENIAASGKANGRLAVQGKDEISSLASHINHMLASLQQSEKVLHEKAEHLQTAVIEAQIANQAKTEFLSGVSHELRTPLTAIIGLGQILQKRYYGNLNAKQLEYINDILDSSNHLLSLINDILDLAKIEAGKTSLELAETRIRELMESSLLLVKESANKKGLFLNLDVPEEILDRSITVDKRRFRQIMINLLSNAVKFTSSGSVSIRAEFKTDYIEFVVSDTGIGIRNEEQQKIFNAFYQIRAGTIGKSPGTGLGLSLAKRFVEQHQGKIWVESEGPGKGSRFHFTISLRLYDKISGNS